MKNILMTSGIGLLLLGAVSAQETPRFAFNLGGGFTTPVGKTGTKLNNGWNFDAGSGINFHPYVGALVQFNDSQFETPPPKGVVPAEELGSEIAA